MKKVLIICSLYHPHVGGIETMVTELARFLLDKGVETNVLTKKWPRSLAEKDHYNGINVYRVLSAREEYEYLDIIDWLINNESEIKSDIIHIIGVRRPLPLIGLLLSRRWKVPCISTIAGSEIPNKEDRQSEITWNEGKDNIPFVLKYSDMITCVSKSLKYDLLKVLPTLKLCKITYAGIDINYIKSIPKPKNIEKYIISLRRLIPSKGVDVLIRAFKDISTEFPNIKLLVAGDGSEKDKLIKLAKSLKMYDKVKFLGTIPIEKSISLLKGAICTVVPSLSEGGSIVNIEAQAALCPVIASNVGGIPEYIQDKKSGLLFEPKNKIDLAMKIRIILNSTEIRDSLVKGGVKHAEKFSWERLGPQYLTLYNKTINNMQNKPFQPWSELSNKLWIKLNEKHNNTKSS